ncbi:DNA ligase (NAD+) [Natranaerovirga pectinivora]|uniref:DNA ligase n=1 Tax=Natranaerovirga pectinivora TaxID=682400 RepID=A0A4R3MKY1_9FIRM|nr:NAD-dependent DNA ligase LigA [Natranaerovirga pectinivora]TCT15322.1 DNA ligase (NAD+) [Natranaerovirga pectinivora]
MPHYSLIKIRELIKTLNEANKAYYQENREIMSNYEYDKLYDELCRLEDETGIILSNSPTQIVGYEVLNALPKEAHDLPMLSLDKTKEVDKLKDWLGSNKGILSWKLDGLTIVLTYRNGKLYKAITRGNGEIGEVVTSNAKVFKNVPLTISYKEELILRGEAVIKYSDFEKINEEIPNEEKYKNPRNLCSGTVRQLNNEITAKRNVNFFAFQVIKAEDENFNDSKIEQLKWLDELGFECVQYKVVASDSVEEKVKEFAEEIISNDFGSDGLVLTFDSISYSSKLGATSKFPRDSIAFKWVDEIKETRLIKILWSTSRTGLINPVAIFEPIELEGTTVSRASVHNVSILEALELGEGDTIQVYKANMIIPQVASNLTKSGAGEIPKECPVCGGETTVKKIKDVKALYCTNDECGAKKLKAFAHFVSRNAMNIEGLSEATLEKFIQRGFITTFADVYRLETYEDAIKDMEGFGEKSYNNLISSVEKSRHIPMPNFIYALGIANIGLSNAKLLCKYYSYNINAIREASAIELESIQGFGKILAESINEYFNNKKRIEEIEDLLQYIEFNIPKQENKQVLEGKVFVITGSLTTYENRDQLKEVIESLGGKVTGSVSNKTNYLINNDTESSSSKNKKAISLDVPIISEEQFNTLISESVE